MTIPFEPTIYEIPINIHLITEYLAFFISYRYYVWLRKSAIDRISNRNRISIILGAVIGAFLGSRIIGILENPIHTFQVSHLGQLLQVKSIMGGLFGGLIGVEISKIIIKEKLSSGDLFTFPIIVGIIIGRIGCFLSGTKEFTYGKETNFFTGMNLGDGIYRHPIALYEIIFLNLLMFFLKKNSTYLEYENGKLFKVFMISYFGFRFVIEFIKPNTFFILELSSIQWLCIICWLYYFPTLKKMIQNAH